MNLREYKEKIFEIRSALTEAGHKEVKLSMVSEAISRAFGESQYAYHLRVFEHFPGEDVKWVHFPAHTVRNLSLYESPVLVRDQRACPFCHSEDLRSAPLAFAESNYASKVHCKTCAKSWTENWSLIGYEIRDFNTDVSAVVSYIAQRRVEISPTTMLETIEHVFGEHGWSAHRQALAVARSVRKASEQAAKRKLEGKPIELTPAEWSRESQQPMSEDQFLASKGTLCPVCGSTHLHHDEGDSEGILGWAPVKCLDCEVKFVTGWGLMGQTGREDVENSTLSS